MEGSSRLYDELRYLLGQSKTWADARHLQTLVWMVIGLICSGCISLTQWGVYMQRRALFAQSRQRRFSRWLHNPRINVQRLYSPVIRTALSQWQEDCLYLSLDTTMLWGQYCIIRLAIIYRGRAVPVVWRVLAPSTNLPKLGQPSTDHSTTPTDIPTHGWPSLGKFLVPHESSSVALETYKALLNRAASLLPSGVRVVLLADRGFADTKLMQHARQQLDWHYRIRVKSDFWVWRPGKALCQVSDFHLGLGEAKLLQGVKITKTQPLGPVYLALARECVGGQLWYIVSSEPTTLQTFAEYGLRFDIEENFLDDKSNGFQLESSLIRSTTAVSRLCLVLAIATVYLNAQGTQVVESGKRRWVAPHWERGNSYLRIGWEWVKLALTKGWDLFQTLHLSGKPDPEPAIASRKQAQKQWLREFTVRSYNYAA